MEVAKDPKRSKDVPVTVEYVDGVEARLTHRITSVELAVKALEKRTDGRFAQIDGRFAQIDGRFAQIDGRFEKVDGQFAELKSMIAKNTELIQKVLVAVQAQEDRNLFVLDGYTSLYDDQKEIKERLKLVERKVFGIDKGN